MTMGVVTPEATQNASTAATLEAIDRMCAVLKGAVPLMPLLPLILTVLLWERSGGWFMGIWLLVALTVPAARYALVRRYRPGATPIDDARRWAGHVTMIALLDGLVWGVAGFSFIVADSVPLQTLLITMIIGTCAGSIFATSFWPITEYAIAIPALGLTALGLWMQGTGGSQGMALGLVVYMGILYGTMKHAHGAVMHTIHLHLENLALVEQLRAQKAVAEQANLAKSKFLAAASHDLRQPLHALGLFVAALRERVERSSDRPLVDNISRSVEALEGLFDALLDISRLDAGIVQPQVRHFRARDLFGRLNTEFMPLARAKGLEFRCEGPDIVLLTDPVLLETILRNLIGNAIRYTSHGSVTVHWRKEESHALVAVHDTGIGIAEEHQTEIFREFFQLHNPERDRNKGLGLGLAIVQRLTHLMKYSLELQSSPGNGSRFSLRIPLGEAAAVSNDVEASVGLPPIGDKHALVLVIDDEAPIRDAMTVLLEDWGYSVKAVADAEEAVAALPRAPDVIIADFRLRDEKTGAQAIRLLEERWAMPIPALILTGDTAPERLRQARESGYELLHKPVQPGKLRAFLRLSARSAAPLSPLP